MPGRTSLARSRPVPLAAGQVLDQGQGLGGLGPGPAGHRPTGIGSALLAREAGDPYDLDQHGGGNGFGGELHVHSLLARSAAGSGMPSLRLRP